MEDEGTTTQPNEKAKETPMENKKEVDKTVKQANTPTANVNNKPQEGGAPESNSLRYEADEFGENHVTGGTADALIYALATEVKGQIGMYSELIFP